MPLTEEEKQVWAAAYAAAYVEDFTASRKLAEARGPRERVPNTYFPFDEAAKNTSAEYAMGVANLAVKKLREWVSSEGPSGVPLIVYGG